MKLSMSDVRAGLVVSLIALPLSLGISLASGAPSSAGLISAILGGLLGAYLGGAHVTINGPAAGLIVVVLTCVQNLADGDPMTGFRRMLACVVVVGLLQIVSGLLKAGRLAALFPLSVVHGMLASIGLIIMIKQAHVFLGHSAKGSIFSSLGQIPHNLLHPVPESALIGLFSMVLLLIYPHFKFKIAKIIPAPLIVAIMGIGLGLLFKPEAMVKLSTNPAEYIITPLFDVIFTWKSIVSIFTIFFVASLESVLSASAVDQLDPLGRETNFDRELWSKGLVNLACGLIGGLPIIAEIVRSSANISQGARSPLANFAHGFFILCFVLLFPAALNMIPLSALAAILVLIGYRLANPKQFQEMWHLGTNSFLAFTTTIVVTLAEDLLIGIFAGMMVKFILSMVSGAKLKAPSFRIEDNGGKAMLAFEGSLSFFSALKQREIFSKLSQYREIQIDLTNVSFIDATSLMLIAKESDRIGKSGGSVKVNLPEKYETVYKHLKSH